LLGKNYNNVGVNVTVGRCHKNVVKQKKTCRDESSIEEGGIHQEITFGED
jgi:hypothetical protein